MWNGYFQVFWICQSYEALYDSYFLLIFVFYFTDINIHFSNLCKYGKNIRNSEIWILITLTPDTNVVNGLKIRPPYFSIRALAFFINFEKVEVKIFGIINEAFEGFLKT